ncbi:MAG TPA: hypothetical protein VKI99_21310 [Candidatus Dormibacteraeota bacterium]|nr:hypothetical protein [Candidatus Dormibacteraeota bacterium]
MRGAIRTVLVLSERPHPWAFIRDSLDPELVSVEWARPSEFGAHVAMALPWSVAGTGAQPAPDLAHLAGTLFSCRWVGPAPDRLPVRPLIRPSWQAISTDLQQALGVRLRGLRLAPGGGLRLPDGSFVSRVGELEALLSTHPDGIELVGRTAREPARRMSALIGRLGLPLQVRCAGGRIRLAEAEDFADGSAA